MGVRSVREPGYALLPTEDYEHGREISMKSELLPAPVTCSALDVDMAHSRPPANTINNILFDKQKDVAKSQDSDPNAKDSIVATSVVVSQSAPHSERVAATTDNSME